MRKIKARYIIIMLSLLTAACLAACSAKQQSTRAPERQSSKAPEQQSTRAPEQQSTKSKGYDTPEKAVSAYLDGLKKMDLGQMIGAFAVDIYVDNQDFEGQINRIKAYTYNVEIKLPNATALAEDLNVESRKSNISTSILRQYMLLAGLGSNLVEVQDLREEGRAAEFTAQFTQKLADVKTETIKLLGFIPPEDISEVYAMDANQENIAKQAELIGADEIQSRIAVFEMEGEEYLMCVSTINYEGKWYLLELGGNIGALLNVDAMSGGLLPLTGLKLDTDWEELMVPVS